MIYLIANGIHLFIYCKWHTLTPLWEHYFTDHREDSEDCVGVCVTTSITMYIFNAGKQHPFLTIDIWE